MPVYITYITTGKYICTNRQDPDLFPQVQGLCYKKSSHFAHQLLELTIIGQLTLYKKKIYI